MSATAWFRLTMYETDAWMTRAVGEALENTYAKCAGGDLLAIFMMLSEQLRARGVEPEAGPVFDWAQQIVRRNDSVLAAPWAATHLALDGRAVGRRRAASQLASRNVGFDGRR